VSVRTRWVVCYCCKCDCIELFILVTCLNIVLSIMSRTVDVGVYYHICDIMNYECLCCSLRRVTSVQYLQLNSAYF
jgi:hypothetical protein